MKPELKEPKDTNMKIFKRKSSYARRTRASRGEGISRPGKKGFSPALLEEARSQFRAPRPGYPTLWEIVFN